MAAFVAQLPPDAGHRRRLAYYPDGYHMLLRDLGGAGVAADVASWIADRRAPLPSQADRAERAPDGRRVASGANLTLETERLRRELTPKLTIAAVGWGGSPCPEETLPTRTRNGEVGGERAFAQPI